MRKSRSWIREASLLPWQTLLIILGVVGFLFYRLLKSPTVVGSFLSSIFLPSSASEVTSKEDAFDKKVPPNPTWTPERIRSDARQVAYIFGTGIHDWLFLDHLAWPWNKTKAFEIIKNYTNPVYNKQFKDAYSNIYTNGNNLGEDCSQYLQNYYQYLLDKQII